MKKWNKRWTMTLLSVVICLFSFSLTLAAEDGHLLWLRMAAN